MHQQHRQEAGGADCPEETAARRRTGQGLSVCCGTASKRQPAGCRGRLPGVFSGSPSVIPQLPPLRPLRSPIISSLSTNQLAPERPPIRSDGGRGCKGFTCGGETREGWRGRSKQGGHPHKRWTNRPFVEGGTLRRRPRRGGQLRGRTPGRPSSSRGGWGAGWIFRAPAGEGETPRNKLKGRTSQRGRGG